MADFFQSLSPKTKGCLFSILGAISASMFFIPYKIVSLTLPLLPFIFVVYIFSFLFNGLFLFLEQPKKEFPELFGSSLKKSILIGIGFGVISVFGNYGIGRSLEGVNPGLSVVVLRTQVLFVVLMGILFLKEKLNSYLIFSLIFCTLGFIILNAQKITLTTTISPFIWALLAAFSFASIQIVLKKFIDSIYPVFINFIRLFAGLLVMLCLPSLWNYEESLTIQHILLAGTAAFFGPFLSRNFQMFAMKYIPVSEFILFTMLTPVMIVLLSWFVWNELPSLVETAGGSFIMAGIFIAIMNRTKVEPKR